MGTLTLHLSTEQVDTHCRVLITQTRHSGQTLAALTALYSFISATARPDEQTNSMYSDIKEIFNQHIASARNSVMEENLTHLLESLDQQNLAGIENVHAALSRNGFHQIVLFAIQQLPDDKLRAAFTWVSDWYQNARTRAEAACPYPDALDLHGAGISRAQYAAMSELYMYLFEAVH